MRIIVVIFLVLFLFVPRVGTEQVAVIGGNYVPTHLRIDNSLTESEMFESAEKGIEWFMRNWNIKGSSVAIAKEGKLLYARGFGYASLSDSLPVEPYHRFRVASVSKLITAVAIMKLQEEGRLTVNEKVFGPGAILDDTLFAHPKDKRVFDITVAHLLAHEGGWSQRYGDQMFMPEVIARTMDVSMPVDLKTIIRFALSKNLHFTPGTGQSYSNLGYSILGLVIEEASGMDYETYCRRRILEPLGIFDMSLGHNLPEAALPLEVSYYEVENAPLKPSVYGTGEMVPASRGGNDIEALGAAGGWVATAPDLMRLLLAVDGFDEPKDILMPESIEFMTDVYNGYAPVGWRATMPNGTWWRTGSFSGTTAMLKRLPDGTAWVVLMNSSAWNGPELTSDIDHMMARFLQRVNAWPETDLFSYSAPVPLRF
ncbi:MAG: serine hydrolase domain-containing protein [Bacteroidales bacterium]|jgi:CubicO group peptidase (beta-lactamase class C family)|nr:serine hydrolase domain-containing protein [Bacteroidales bacterium]